MGEIFGTCGHKVEWDTEGCFVRYDEKDGTLGYSFVVYCAKCRAKYKALASV